MNLVKKIILLILLINFQINIIAQAPIIEWQNSYGGSGQELPSSIIKTSDGGYIMAGYSNSNDGDLTTNLGSEDYWIVKTNVNGVIEWQKSYGGTNYEYPSEIKQTTDGGYVVIGYTSSSDGDITNLQGYTDFWIIKLTNNGALEWQKTYGGTGIDDGYSIQQTTDGGYIVIGETNSINGDVTGNHGSIDYWVIKLNSIGLMEWQKTFGGSAIDEPSKIKQTTDGGYIAIGCSTSNNGDVSGNHGQKDYWVVKLNSTGTIEWQKTIGGSADDYADDIEQTSDGGYIIAGTSFSTNGDRTSTSHGGCDYWVVKLNSIGNITWEKSYGYNSNDIPNSIEQTQDGGYIIAGWADVSGWNYIDYWIIKLDSFGNLEWQKSLGGYGYDRATGILEVTDGTYIVVGYSSSANGDVIGNHGNYDYWILQLQACNTSTPIGNPNQIFCASQNPSIANLSPNSSSIKWYDSPTSTNQLSNTILLINGNTYYAARQILGCSESIQRLAVTVTVNQTPNLSVSTNQFFCESENSTISNLNVVGQNMQWYPSLLETNTLSLNTPLQNNTNYYVSQTINGCESSRSLINVTINSAPMPTLTSPQIFCIGQNSTLNSITVIGQNIKWYDAQISGNQLANTTLLVNGTSYYASQTVNNCESIRVPVIIYIQNTIAPTGTMTQTFCSTQNPTLNDINVIGTNLLCYSSATSALVLPATTSILNNVTYFFSQTVNGCESTARIPITVLLISNLNAYNYAEIICDELNDNSEIIDLTNYNTNLITNATSETFEYYSTLNGAIYEISSELISVPTNYNLVIGSHTIWVRITSNNGCYQVVELNLELVSKPKLPFSEIIPICEGSSVNIDAGFGFDSYLWSTGAFAQDITVSQTGNYSVTVTKTHTNMVCTTTQNFSVVQSSIATIINIENTDWTDNENIITVIVTSGSYEFSLDGIHYQDSNVFSGLNSGIYTVYVRDKNGCGTVNELVFLLMYDKYFTPNDDGYNDTWSIQNSFLEPGLKVSIFDRYGKLLKQLGNINSWDGTLNGHNLPSDDYWFVVTRNNGKEYRGHFALKR